MEAATLFALDSINFKLSLRLIIIEFLWLEVKPSSKLFNIETEFYKVMRYLIEPKYNNGTGPEEKLDMSNFLLCFSLRFWFIFLSFCHCFLISGP